MLVDPVPLFASPVVPCDVFGVTVNIRLVAVNTFPLMR